MSLHELEACNTKRTRCFLGEGGGGRVELDRSRDHNRFHDHINEIYYIKLYYIHHSRSSFASSLHLSCDRKRKCC